MSKPTLYKKRPVVDIRNRATTQLSEDEKSAVNGTVAKFFDLFKLKHLS